MICPIGLDKVMTSVTFLWTETERELMVQGLARYTKYFPGGSPDRRSFILFTKCYSLQYHDILLPRIRFFQSGMPTLN
jgi:hypothetical protein